MTSILHVVHDDEARTVRERTVARAAEDFKDHEVTAVGAGQFLCKRPAGHAHSGYYWWRLIFVPCHVIMVGDLGSAVWRVSDGDSLQWLLGMKGRQETDYILSKLEHREYDFLVQEAKRAIAEMHDEYPLKAERIDEAWTDEDSYESFAKAWYEVTGDAELPGVTYPTFQDQYRVQALLWFANHYEVAVDDESKCAWCGWPVKATVEEGCIRGNCSRRPYPEKPRWPERAQRELEAFCRSQVAPKELVQP